MDKIKHSSSSNEEKVSPEKTLVFLPAWNEEGAIVKTVTECKNAFPDADILVIDDGSGDNTAAKAKKAGALVFSFPENRGIGSAVARGWKIGWEEDYDFIVRLDADGQHPPSEGARILAELKKSDADALVGSRFLPGSGAYTPKTDRLIGQALLRFLLSAQAGRPVSDGTSGMYAARKSAAELLKEPYSIAAPEVEGILRMKELKVQEIPVQMLDRVVGQSSLRGKRAVELVASVTGVLIFGGLLLKMKKKKEPENIFKKYLNRL